jgi:hypothetical protein
VDIDVDITQPAPDGVSVSDGAGHSHTFGDFSDGETKSTALNITKSSSELNFSGTSGNIDYKLKLRERTATNDPVVELNGDPGQQVAVDGALGEGQTVIKQIDNSWLESGDNTATVTLNNSSLPAGSPPMEARVSVEKPAQSARYVSASYTNLSRSNGVGVDWSGSGTLDVTVQGWTGSSWEDARQLSTSQTGDVVLDYAPIDYGQTRVEIVANDNVEIREESIQFFTSTPEIDEGSATPASGDSVSNSPVQLNISVSDADFSTSQGDSVDVTFYDASDDSEIGTDTLTANGTATTSWSNVVGGDNDWYAVAADSYGNSVQSQTFTFKAPATLSIRDEETQDLITGANSTVEVRFYQEGSDQVVKRTTTTGEIDLSGLPLGELVVSANVEGYENRRIVLESITEQSNIYLLNNTADSVPVEFELDDRTGEYNAEETTLYIEKSLPDGDGDNSTETYQVLAADFFGANGRYPAVLEKGARYRLRVENADGDTRALGSYTPNEPEVTPLPIGNVELTADTDGGTALQASVRDAPETATHNYEIRVVYADLENQTDSFDLSIQDGNGTQLRPNVSQTGPFGTYVETVPVEKSSWDPENSTATITLTANRGTDTVQLTEQVGRVPGLFEDSRINSQILELMGIVSLVAIVGLLVIANPTIAAVVGVGYAGLLAIVGIVSIPMAAIGLAGSVAALFAAGGGDRT